VIHSIIPARQGSTEVLNKNILHFRGKPLMFWAIDTSLKSSCIDLTYVSTDSLHYQSLAVDYGALSLGVRPAAISTKYSRDLEFLQFHLSSLSQLGLPTPDLLVLLRPTSPLRDAHEIDEAITYFLDNYDSLDSIRSVSISRENPFKAWKYTPDSRFIEPVVGSLQDDFINSPRQILPQTLWQNGNFDILKPSVILSNSHLGSRVYPWLTSTLPLDIDTLEDFQGPRAM